VSNKKYQLHISPYHMQTHLEEDNLAVAKRLEQEDFGSDRFLDGLSEDVEWWAAGPPVLLPWAGLFRGRGMVAEWVKTLRSNLNYQEWKSEWMVKGDTVVEFVQAKGVARKTGKTYESEIVRVWTIREGKAVKVRSYYDTAAYGLAIGTLSPSSSPRQRAQD
jgi:ketosteroid isomerase-like protein